MRYRRLWICPAERRDLKAHVAGKAGNSERTRGAKQKKRWRKGKKTRHPLPKRQRDAANRVVSVLRGYQPLPWTNCSIDPAIATQEDLFTTVYRSSKGKTVLTRPQRWVVMGVDAAKKRASVGGLGYLLMWNGRARLVLAILAPFIIGRELEDCGRICHGPYCRVHGTRLNLYAWAMEAPLGYWSRAS